MNWIFPEQLRKAELNIELSRTAEAALRTTIIDAIYPETRARLTPNLEKMTVRNILNAIEEIFIDKADKRQEQLRKVPKKIKMTRNKNVTKYISKHRDLSKDSITAGCQEIETDG